MSGVVLAEWGISLRGGKKTFVVEDHEMNENTIQEKLVGLAVHLAWLTEGSRGIGCNGPDYDADVKLLHEAAARISELERNLASDRERSEHHSGDEIVQRGADSV